MRRTDLENELAEALQSMLITFGPVFRLKPIGAPGSTMRQMQEAQIDAFDKAIAALRKAGIAI